MRAERGNTDAELQTATPRISALVDAARLLQVEEGHSVQVARLALHLFDQLRERHGLASESRELLLGAALLHDAGVRFGVAGHHKRSRKLIEQASLPGFTARERGIIALVARYHRKALPSLSQAGYSELDETDQEQVRKLAAILRVADGLDRTHGDVVATVRIVERAEGIVLEVTAGGPAEAEVWTAESKADLFRETYGSLTIRTV